MFSIATLYTTNPASGAGKVVAKGHGKQRTVPYDFTKSPAANHAAAVGALLNVLATPEQRAKVLHPSGGQRVRNEILATLRQRWTVNV